MKRLGIAQVLLAMSLLAFSPGPASAATVQTCSSNNTSIGIQNSFSGSNTFVQGLTVPSNSTVTSVDVYLEHEELSQFTVRVMSGVNGPSTVESSVVKNITPRMTTTAEWVTVALTPYVATNGRVWIGVADGVVDYNSVNAVASLGGCFNNPYSGGQLHFMSQGTWDSSLDANFSDRDAMIKLSYSTPASSTSTSTPASTTSTSTPASTTSSTIARTTSSLPAGVRSPVTGAIGTSTTLVANSPSTTTTQEDNSSTTTAPSVTTVPTISIQPTLVDQLSTVAPSVVVGGAVQPANVVRTEGRVLVEINDVGVSFGASNGDYTTAVVPQADGRLSLTPGIVLNVVATGLIPGSEASVWLFSDPQFIDVVDVDETGRAEYELVLDGETDSGNHHLAIVGQSPGMADLAVFFPFEYVVSDGGVNFFVWVLLGAVLLSAVFVPAQLMKRRRTAVS